MCVCVCVWKKRKFSNHQIPGPQWNKMDAGVASKIRRRRRKKKWRTNQAWISRKSIFFPLLFLSLSLSLSRSLAPPRPHCHPLAPPSALRPLSFTLCPRSPPKSGGWNKGGEREWKWIKKKILMGGGGRLARVDVSSSKRSFTGGEKSW